MIYPDGIVSMYVGLPKHWYVVYVSGFPVGAPLLWGGVTTPSTLAWTLGVPVLFSPEL